MTDTGEYSEVSQLRTRCTILESQIQVLEKQNSDLKSLLQDDATNMIDEETQTYV